MATQLIPGAPIKLGNRDYIVPALSFGQIKRLKTELTLTDNPTVMTDTVFDGIITIIVAALSRNYPKLTRKEVEDFIDFNNVKPLMQAIKGESGFITDKINVSDSENSGELKPGA